MMCHSHKLTALRQRFRGATRTFSGGAVREPDPGSSPVLLAEGEARVGGWLWMSIGVCVGRSVRRCVHVSMSVNRWVCMCVYCIWVREFGA